MKTDSHFDADGWLTVHMIPETVEEASMLVYHGLNADAKSRAVCSVHAEPKQRDGKPSSNPVNGYIQLRTKQKRTSKV